jgi:hypothetical protein
MRIVDVTASKFNGLVNPYTGDPIKVKMMIPDSGKPFFFAPDTFTHAAHYPTAKEAIDAWDRDNGIQGVKDRSCLLCPYTGESLTVRQDVAGFFLSGGFDPRRFWTDDEFVYFASSRMGKTDYPKPGALVRVESVPERPDEMPRETETVERTDEARKVAEAVVDQFKDSVGMKKATVVSVSGKGKRK